MEGGKGARVRRAGQRVELWALLKPAPGLLRRGRHQTAQPAVQTLHHRRAAVGAGGGPQRRGGLRFHRWRGTGRVSVCKASSCCLAWLEQVSTAMSTMAAALCSAAAALPLPEVP